MKMAVTGHRPKLLNNEYNGIGPCSDFIRSKLYKIIGEYSPDLMISGMALGIDMIFAEVAIKKNIPLLAAIPCLEQEKVWPQKSQDRYNKILTYDKCTKYLVSNCKYNYNVMFDRNKFMVNEADVVVAFWTGIKSGTSHCVEYARKMNKKVLIINPQDYSNAME